MGEFIAIVFIIWIIWYLIKVITQGNSSHSSKLDYRDQGPDPTRNPESTNQASSSTSIMEPLKGQELLEKVVELGDVSKADLVRGCGYGIKNEDGEVRLDFYAFYQELLRAKGVDIPEDMKSRPRRKELLKLVKELGNMSKSNLVIQSGYVYEEENGGKQPDFYRFHKALGMERTNFIDYFSSLKKKVSPSDQSRTEDKPTTESEITVNDKSVGPLKGQDLLDKIEQLGNMSKTEIVRKCGYVFINEEGKESPDLGTYFEALLEAKGIGLSTSTKDSGTKSQNAEEYFELGRAKSYEQDHEGAIDEFSKAIDIDPNYADAYALRGCQKTYINDHQGVIDDYTKAIEINPSILLWYNNRAGAKSELGDHEGAQNDYIKCLDLDPENPNTNNYLGNTKLLLKDYNGAIKNYDKVIENDVWGMNSEAAYVNRGKAKEEIGEVEKAIDDYTRAIEIENLIRAEGKLMVEEDDIKYYLRGSARVNIEDFEDGINDLTKAIEINPKSADAYNNRGFAKSELEDFKGAIEDYNLAIKIDPSIANTYNNRANAKSELEDFKGAIEDHDKAIKIEPTSLFSFFNRGVLKKKMEDIQGAIHDFSKVLEIDPSFSNAYFLRGDLLFQEEDFEGASKDFEKVIEFGEDPCLGEVYRKNGIAKKELGNMEDACNNWYEAGDEGDEDAEDLIKEYCE